MNGERRYKVTIHAVDHLPSLGGEDNILHHFHQVQKNGQKKVVTSRITDETNSMHRSEVSFQVNDMTAKASVVSYCTAKSKSHFIRSYGECLDKTCTDNMQESRTEFYVRPSEYNTSSVISKSTSLNINKLTKSISVKEEHLQDDATNGDFASKFSNLESPKTVKYITTETIKPIISSCSDCELNNAAKQRPFNDFRHRHLPKFKLNSESMNDTKSEIPRTAIGKTLSNGTEGNPVSNTETFSRKRDGNRPPFTREGSACSSDSIIMEIEGLSDDECEFKGSSTKDEKADYEKVHIWYLFKVVLSRFCT